MIANPLSIFLKKALILLLLNDAFKAFRLENFCSKFI